MDFSEPDQEVLESKCKEAIYRNKAEMREITQADTSLLMKMYDHHPDNFPAVSAKSLEGKRLQPQTMTACFKNYWRSLGVPEEIVDDLKAEHGGRNTYIGVCLRPGLEDFARDDDLCPSRPKVPKKRKDGGVKAEGKSPAAAGDADATMDSDGQGTLD